MISIHILPIYIDNQLSSSFQSKVIDLVNYLKRCLDSFFFSVKFTLASLT